MGHTPTRLIYRSLGRINTLRMPPRHATPPRGSPAAAHQQGKQHKPAFPGAGVRRCPANTSGPQPLRRAPPAARSPHKLEPLEDGRGRSAANLERGFLFGDDIVYGAPQSQVSVRTYMQPSTEVDK
uniref:Uncharacterized protein n=1 Tax=Setaria viridis TaxID=4556 RepID=A0A4U6VE17_SETVI|nr:hypothetical protein SEVIR_3G199600v2 [Setaria viridis]